MSDTVIRVERLAKRYTIRHANGRASSDGLRHAISDAVAAPLRKFLGRAVTPVSTEDFYALQDVSFEVKRGEVLGIIGRNGAGKSTLLKILSRITEPTSGRIGLKGRIASLLEVGTGFHPELTGRENIYLNGAILGMSRAEVKRKFDEIVEFSGVERFLDTPVKRYSSGMYVRLAFAVAAHLDPEILIVDEVLAVGDAEFQKKCLGKMKNVARDGRTILFVSHNMVALGNLCNRAICFTGGRLTADGAPHSVISNYLAVAEEKRALPLAERTDREGSQAARITSLRIRNATDSKETISPTDPVLVELEYEADCEFDQAVCALGIYDQRLTRIAHLTTNVKNLETTHFSRRGMFRCEIPSLPLNVGRYSVNVSLHSGNALLDRVEFAGSFSVVIGDVFGSGKMISPELGILLIDHDWDYSPR